jgi:hypothetical protein
MLSSGINVERVQLGIMLGANTTEKLTLGDFEGFGSNIHLVFRFVSIQVL